MTDLTETVTVITGGASGIGRAIAITFARHGGDVVIADVRSDPRAAATPTTEYIETHTDQRAEFVACDVTNKDDLETAVDQAEALGGLDVMVNNAGIFRSEEFLDVSEAEFDRLMAVNVKGVFFGAQTAASAMIERDGGSIINLSSIAGIRGVDNFVTYCTSKGAVRLMTYALADKLGPQGIRVNALHPGLIETSMTTDDVPIISDDESGQRREDGIPKQRFGQPEDVADAALFLASEQADYVTGESLLVDGGITNTN